MKKANREKHLVTLIPNGGSPLLSQKIGRNILCPCGSGKKAKKCCGTESKYYLTGKAAAEKNTIKDNKV